MKKFIFIGDMHWIDKEPFLTGLIKLNEWIYDNYKDYVIFVSGDWYDKNSPNWENAYRLGLNALLKYNEVHYICGNHELGKRGNLVVPLQGKFPNLNIYTEKTEVTIHGYKFLMLPFLYDRKLMNDYGDIRGEYDFVFNHVSPPNMNYGHEEIDFKNLSIKQGIMYGHIHSSVDFKDENNNMHYVIGVPQITKSGENSIKRIIEFDGSEIKSTEVPVFMDIQNISYNTDIESLNVDWLYNIEDAPSIKDVNSKFSDYHINSIKILRTKLNSSVSEIVETNFNTSLEEKLVEFAKQEQVSEEVLHSCLQLLLEAK